MRGMAMDGADMSMDAMRLDMGAADDLDMSGLSLDGGSRP